jgi:malonyl-CoA O-methyltransferase
LRQSWAAADNYSHVHTFIDMHDLGDALLRAQFSEPVVDVERITLTYRNLSGLMGDLKALGAQNITPGRRRSLTGKGCLGAMEKTYEGFRRHGLLPATCEIVYGHAWEPQRNLSTTRRDGVAVFPLSRLGRQK